MSFYTDVVAVSPADDGWRLLTDLRWEIGKKGSGHVVEVKAGFKSDLATIPWWARGILNPADPRFAKAAILHDYLLTDPEFSRVTAASEFAQALIADGVNKHRAIIMGLAVLVHTTR